MAGTVLIIDKDQFTILEKGFNPFQSTFSSEEKSFALITEELKKRRPDKLDIYFSDSILISKTVNSGYENKKEFIVDEGVIGRFLENMSYSFLEENNDKDLMLVSRELVSLSLNGYFVSRAAGQKVEKLKAVIFLSGISKKYVEDLLSGLHFIHKNSISLFSLAFSTAESAYQKHLSDNFIFCFSTGSTIDVSIKNGREFFETISLKTGSKMKKDLEDILSRLGKDTMLPRKVFIAVPEDMKKDLEECFDPSSYHSLCFTEGKFDVTPLDWTSLFNI